MYCPECNQLMALHDYASGDHCPSPSSSAPRTPTEAVPLPERHDLIVMIDNYHNKVHGADVVLLDALTAIYAQLQAGTQDEESERDWVREAHEARLEREATGLAAAKKVETRLRELLLECSEFLPTPTTLNRGKYGRDLRAIWERIEVEVAPLREGEGSTRSGLPHAAIDASRGVHPAGTETTTEGASLRDAELREALQEVLATIRGGPLHSIGALNNTYLSANQRDECRAMGQGVARRERSERAPPRRSSERRRLSPAGRPRMGPLERRSVGRPHACPDRAR